MHKLTKIFLLCMCLLLLLSSITFGLTPEMEQAGETLKTLNILKGYEDGSLRLSNHLTRAEFCTMMMRMLGYDTVHYTQEPPPFSDIPKGHWASPFIADARAYGLVAGDPDGRFRPDDTVSYAETVVVTMRLLKWDPDAEKAYPNNYIDVADGNKLTEGLFGTVPEKAATRGEIALLLENALSYEIR